MAAVTDRGAIHIGSLFKDFNLAQVPKQKPLNERAELVRYFFENAQANWDRPYPLTKARIGMKLAHLSMLDLRAFKSMCEDRKRTGYPWAKFFWGALKVKKS